MPVLSLQSCKRKGQNGPVFWGPISDCNAGFLQWCGLVETLLKGTGYHVVHDPGACFVYVIEWFWVQLGISMACAICSLWKIYKCFLVLLSNCTRKIIWLLVDNIHAIIWFYFDCVYFVLRLTGPTYINIIGLKWQPWLSSHYRPKMLFQLKSIYHSKCVKWASRKGGVKRCQNLFT